MKSAIKHQWSTSREKTSAKMMKSRKEKFEAILSGPYTSQAKESAQRAIAEINKKIARAKA